MSRDDETVVDALRRHAAERPLAPALVSEDRAVAYGELAARVGGCAHRLASLGVARGECVGISVANEIEHIVVALGLASLGAAYVVLPTFERAAMRARLAARVGARRVVTDEAVEAPPGIDVIAQAATRPASDERELAMPAARGDASALLTWYSTSGPTGEARLVAMTHRRFIEHARRMADTPVMPLSSIEHQPAGRLVHCMILLGSRLALRGRSRTPVARLCERLGAGVVLAMPSQARTLLDEAAGHGRLPAGTLVRIADAQVSTQFRREMLSRACDALEVIYASPECGPIARRVERDPARVSDTVGHPGDGVEIRIVDGHGKALPPGRVGEIRVRTPSMTSRYHDDPAATARHFVDGEFRPGDIGSITPDGEILLEGCSDGAMSLNGIRIAPREIEHALERHPAVRSVVAFPLRSQVYGEVPAAAVVIGDGTRVDERELRAWARQALGVRAPRRVRIVAEFPVTAEGEVDRRRLAEETAAGVS